MIECECVISVYNKRIPPTSSALSSLHRMNVIAHVNKAFIQALTQNTHATKVTGHILSCNIVMLQGNCF